MGALNAPTLYNSLLQLRIENKCLKVFRQLESISAKFSVLHRNMFYSKTCLLCVTVPHVLNNLSQTPISHMTAVSQTVPAHV